MKPYHKNPRRITKKRHERLTDTLARLGDLGGIVHNLETDEVIGGNQRMTVFRDGEPVIVEQYDQPDEQGTVAHGFIVWQGKRYAYRQVRWDEATAEEANIAANVGAGTWDWDALSGWDAGDLQAWGFDGETLTNWQADIGALGAMLASEEEPPPDDPGAQVDKAEELREKWGVQPGQLWELDSGNGHPHRLICGDCTDAAVVARLGNVDYLFTDPPYGIDVDTSWLTALHIQRGKPANLSDDKLAGDDGTLDLSWLWQYERRMVWGFPYIFDPQATGWIVWDKQPGVEDRGIVTPIEMASTTMRKGFDMVRVMWGGYYRAAGEDRQPHPTQKPVGVVAPFIEAWTKQGETVFDPFLGSGTTLIACERLGRRCRAVEISPAYVAVAIQRWHDMTGGEPVLIG